MRGHVIRDLSHELFENDKNGNLIIFIVEWV